MKRSTSRAALYAFLHSFSHIASLVHARDVGAPFQSNRVLDHPAVCDLMLDVFPWILFPHTSVGSVCENEANVFDEVRGASSVGIEQKGGRFWLAPRTLSRA